MQIRVYGPFNEKIGKSLIEIHLAEEITLIQFSNRLVDQFPVLKTFLTGGENHDFLNSVFFVARRGIILGPDDIVSDGDELEIMAPVDGG